MSSQQAPAGAGTSQGIERLVPYEQQIGYGLVVVGLALGAIPITNAVLYRGNSLAVLAWGAALTLFVIGVGLYAIMPAPFSADSRDRAERLRWVFLLATGGVGALTALLGLVLPFCTIPMSLTNYPEIFTGGPKSWRANGWPIARCVIALIGGLVLMFVGLQLARPVQRTSMNMRRWLYGYNAVLSSLLLLFILFLVNLLPYTGVRPFSWAKEATDWTTSQMYTLHPATKNLLAEIKEPVKVYLLMPEGHPLTRQVETLLNNCRAVNTQFSWVELSRDRNPLEIAQLMQKYQLPDSVGLLVVHGTDPNVTTQFIKVDELAEDSPGRDSDRSFVFKGENALLNALTYLSGGKAQATVYFTQGNGELDFNDQNRGQQIDAGIGVVQEELGKINFQTRALPLDPKTKSIPDDADIVVIARPREEFPPNVIKALRDYLQGTNRKDNKKGKLMVLFDVALRNGAMIRTGLEGLMAEYGVKVGDNRMMCYRSRNPLQLSVVADPRSTNPVARAFTSQGAATTTFLFYDARTVESVANPPGGANPYTVENLIITIPQTVVWTETDLKANPLELANAMRRDQEKLASRLNERPVPLAVTVTEGKTAAPPIPGHEFMSKEGEPRMVVFGDASWASNRILLQATPDNFALFSSCMSWLSGRHDIGERVPPSTRTMYRLKVPPGGGWRLILLPGVLMMLGVLGLGLGVWVVRRR